MQNGLAASIRASSRRRRPAPPPPQQQGLSSTPLPPPSLAADTHTHARSIKNGQETAGGGRQNDRSVGQVGRAHSVQEPEPRCWLLEPLPATAAAAAGTAACAHRLRPPPRHVTCARLRPSGAQRRLRRKCLRPKCRCRSCCCPPGVGATRRPARRRPPQPPPRPLLAAAPPLPAAGNQAQRRQRRMAPAPRIIRAAGRVMLGGGGR